MAKSTQNREATFPKDIEYLVFDRRKEEEIEFRKHYKKDINNILGHINNIRFMQTVFLLSEPETTSCVLEELSLINKGIDFISSSLILLSHGSILESLALLRLAIESSCSALLIHFDIDEREKYFSRDIKSFRSSKAITYAKQKVKYVGKLYGILSNAAVHVNIVSFCPKLSKKMEKGKVF